MRNIMSIVLVALTLIVAQAEPGFARGGHFRHGGGHFGVGILVDPGWGWGWPYASYPYYPYAPYAPYYAAPPVAAPQEPQEYVQPEQPVYWYYCPDPEGYYPYVKQCPKGWLKVVPSTPPGEEER
jgi:hypothetical protein